MFLKNIRLNKKISIILIGIAIFSLAFILFSERKTSLPEDSFKNQKIEATSSLRNTDKQTESDKKIKETQETKINEKTTTETEKTEQEKLKNAIGQLLIIGFRGTKADKNSYIAKTIRDLKIGGVVLFDIDNPTKSFPRNIENPKQLKKLIADLQNYSKIPLFVSVDAEGGKINRLKPRYGFIEIPSAQKMGEKEFSYTENIASKLGKELKDLGFNMDFAPVVDLNINPNNPIIGKLERSFSSDPLKITGHAKGFIEGLRSQGIIAVVKHFPGHGSSKQDSHLGLPDVTDTYKEAELFPYHLLQGEGVMDAVMTAHIIDKNIDKKYPASLSPYFINDILRNQVGFMGVVISDDMQMGAIARNYTLEQAIIKAINAGTDMILLSNNSDTKYDEQLPYKARNIILKAIQDKEISEKRIFESEKAVLELKRKFKIISENK